MSKYFAFVVLSLVVVSCKPSESVRSTKSNILSVSLMSAQHVSAQHDLATLAVNSSLVDNGRLNIPANNMTVNVDSLELLSLLIACAIPADTVIDPNGLGFFGEIGLAPNWVTRALTITEKRWISACVIARVSGDFLANAVSLRGIHPALSTNTDEQGGWTLQEGAFYGNIFTAADHPVEWLACKGYNGGNGIDRICAEPDPSDSKLTECGFRFAGNCLDVCKIRPPVSTGFYTQCKNGSQPFLEVITVYLAP